jgi:glycosyltransferase involved in cell wall biosynthesis
MVVGTPVVASNRASLPEVVDTAGVVVDPEDSASVADALIQLQENSQLRADYIQRGYDHAAQYTWSNCVDRLTIAFNTFA